MCRLLPILGTCVFAHLLAHLGAPIDAAYAGIASLKDRWPQGKVIAVCFFGGTQQVRSEVAAGASEWTKDLSVRFDFGSPTALNSCGEGGPYDTRVTFGDLSWAYVGTEATRVEQDKPTLMLPARGNIRTNILHEFGHVLGLLHYEQDPKLKCLDDIDFEYASSVGFSKDGIYGLIRPVAPDNGAYVSTPGDSSSVMRSLTDPRYYKQREKSPCYGPARDTLSESDLSLAKLLYPVKPSQVSSTEPKHIIIRLEGQLAAEHFGYVASALYDVGKITLKKHVSTSEETIADVIAAERLAPKRTTSESLDQFLCSINSHTCRISSDKSTVWTNTTAEKNYVDQGLDCGSKQLPKFVLCIPNIRLESYIVITSIPRPADEKALRELIVDKYRGCDELDDVCKKLIAGLNPERDFVISQKLERIRIPAKGYRLVIEYSNETERDLIDRTVRQVIQKRAKDLRLQPELVAIRISYPVSNPTSQTPGKIFGEPASGYADVLKAMSYPFGDKETEKELFDLPKVAVAIWDNHVDDVSCELAGNIFNTPSERPAGESQGEMTPPSKAGECGKAHPAGYQLTTSFDHATAVAGILSAKVNGKGIAGIIPDMKIWAWEVVNGNQFNAGNNPEVIRIQQYPDLNPTVVNVSQTYSALGNEQGTPALKSILLGDGPENEGLHNIMLFVAAAGASKAAQDGSSERTGIEINLDSDCLLHPACLSNRPGGKPRALISVVALNGAGDGILKNSAGEPLSNFGTAFDVAAVGSVMATFHGDWIGTFRGSSAATPYVTGLAALLTQRTVSKRLYARKTEIKNRILFSADDAPSIRGLSRFGRVNFRKALNFENDYMRFTPSMLCAEDPCVRQVRIDRNIPSKLTISGGTTEMGQPAASQSIDFKQLKSLKRPPDEDTFTVIFMDPGGFLVKITNSQVAPDSKKIVRYKNSDGNVVADSFKTSDLLEYVSCSWYEYCGKSD